MEPKSNTKTMEDKRTLIILPAEKYQAKLFIVAALSYGIPALAILIPFLSVMVSRGIGLTSTTAWTFYWVFGISSVAIWITIVALVPSYFRSISYELTASEVVVRKGVFTKVVKTIPYRNITNVVESRDLIDRYIVNLGSIKIQTAGKSGETGYEACLNGLSDWDTVHGSLLSKMREAPGGIVTSGAARERAEIERLEEVLSELRLIRKDLEHKRGL